MGHITTYSHVTTANIPSESWDEAYLSLASWKGYLQSFPGYLGIRLSSYQLDNGDIKLHVHSVWEYPEQLEEWRESKWSAESLLRELRKPAYDVTVETFEDF